MLKTVEEVLPFTGDAKIHLDAFYNSEKVADSNAERKIAALNVAIGNGESRFFAYGGDESEDMHLRALERIYLLEQGIQI